MPIKKQSLSFWIKEHREVIDAYIDKIMGYRHCEQSYAKIDDAMRREWVMNHEVLYSWALCGGASI